MQDGVLCNGLDSGSEDLRASIIVGCKLAKCWGGVEMRGKRKEVGCKLAACLCIKTKKICESDKWVMH